MNTTFEERLAFVSAHLWSVWAAFEGHYYYPVIVWVLVMIFQRMPDKLQKAEVDVKDGKIELEEEK